MKKLLLSVLGVASTAAINAQVNVSTTPQNRVAVLEEYTGNNCTYCPEGHEIADQLEANYNVVTLKIQTGGFSGTDPIFGGTLETATGNAIAAPYDSQGYPNGTVSRRSAYAGIGRGEWQSAVAAMNALSAPVNIYLESSIDVTTRELTVSAEYYYTANAANATNYLHIGYYQDNIAAYQYDPGFYPSQFYMLEEAVYEFDHAFRDMVNGTWGEAINSTTMGSTGIVNHTITLPATFSTFAVEPGAIKVFAYISTSAQGEILNAGKATPEYLNFPNTDEIGIIYSSGEAGEGCLGSAGEVAPKILVATYGGDNLTSFTTDFDVNGAASSAPWSGNIMHNEKVVVELPVTAFTYITNNTVDVEVTLPNGSADPSLSDNTSSNSFGVGPSANAQEIRIEVKTDAYSMDESEFKIYNGAGTPLLSSGPIPNSATTNYYLDIPAGTDCFKFELLDSYGDGWGYQTTAFMKIYSVTGGVSTLIRTINEADNFGYELIRSMELTSNGSASIEELSAMNFSVFPNPATDVVNVSFEALNADYTVSVLDLQGRVMNTQSFTNLSGSQSIALPVSELAKGSYLVTVSSNGVSKSQNVVIR